VFFDPPALDATVTQNRTYAEVESGQSGLGALRAHVGQGCRGQHRAPTAINEDPYGTGWLVKVTLSDLSEVDSLMSAEEYKATVAS
jgi:glycine cleavage system H protein